MIRDVFYYGEKPNVHPRERLAKNLEDARNQSTTEHFWIINEHCDYRNFDWDFDFEFLPDEDVWAIDHNNVWPSQHQKDSGTWLCSKTYSDTIIYRTDVDPVIRKVNMTPWKLLEDIDISKFDFSWHHDPTEPPFIYRWGCKYYPVEVRACIEYVVPNSTNVKYMDTIVELLPNKNNWNIIREVTNFDFSWRPDPREPSYIYTWGDKFVPAEISPVLEYHVPDATDRKYMGAVEVLPDMNNWKILIPIDMTSFDFSWRPDPREPEFIYVFGNTWNDATTEPTIEYHVPNATKRKYINDIVATPSIDKERWTVFNEEDKLTFDFTWRPNPYSPKQIYQWADNGPRYTVPDATEVVYVERTVARKSTINKYYITTTLEDLINEHTDEVFWALNPDLNYDKFDFNWRPDITNFRHINVFGNEYSKDTQTYYINGITYKLGYKEFNYIEDQLINAETKLSMFYIDKGNAEATNRYNELKTKYPNIQKTRFFNSWIDTINRCVSKSETKLFWVLNSELDYSDFKFDYYPSTWQLNMHHVFGTQFSHWGNTYLINKEIFPENTKYIKVIEHLSNLNFVKTKRAKATNCLYDIYLIDYGNVSNTLEILLRQQKPVRMVKYNENYLNTFKDILNKVVNDDYIWVCSSICDYSSFDFSYICDPFAREQLHVFPSNKQKFGDTFLVNVKKLKELIDNMVELNDYDNINFNQHQHVNRLPAPKLITDDTHVDYVNTEYNFPYAILTTADNADINVFDDEPISLWSEKNINILSSGGSVIVLPDTAKQYVKKELYDYPYIKKSDRLVKSNPLDIVFLSNGESIADENYEHLLEITKNRKNRVVRVDGINGRVQAYHSALKASNTPWAFTVFAKLKVDVNFDFDWQPDRLQVPKHYIFHAKNPVNDLVYGHQALIAYNKKLTLANVGAGLDFTLDDQHEVVEMLSGVANYNTDEYSTWRTAFREVLKLISDETMIGKMRLNAWLNVGRGNYGEYSMLGAKDAVEYYNLVNGELSKLKLSYEWNWLKQYFDKKYS